MTDVSGTSLKHPIIWSQGHPATGLPKIKDEYKLLGTNWIILYVNCDNVTYIDNFEVEHIRKEI